MTRADVMAGPRHKLQIPIASVCRSCRVHPGDWTEPMALIKDADIAALLSTYGVAGVSLAVLQPDGAGDASIATQVAGVAEKRSEPIPVYGPTCFQFARCQSDRCGGRAAVF